MGPVSRSDIGCLCLQYLQWSGAAQFQEPVWFKTGAVILNQPLNYLGQDNLVGARSIIATLAVQVYYWLSTTVPLQDMKSCLIMCEQIRSLHVCSIH